MTSPRPRRAPAPDARKRDPERTRRLILDAATAEFAAHGFAGARIAAIAARAGVNQQLISYYFDGKEGLYRALAERWARRQDELAPAGTPLDEQVRRFSREVLTDPDGVRLFAWGGLEYTGDDPDSGPRAQRLRPFLDAIRAGQAAGRVDARIDPACLAVALMAAALATTSLPHVIAGLCETDPRAPEFVEHYAGQVGLLARLLGLDDTAG
ncbi:TetR/AcrR family transcriptional regulator [Pseudonocardia sp. CA-107938]|uniref:TetR/AcrR family transcriptional regulator n=1 Tax=Pseudonocardia sp. CA-107938 TaxID=3240021 RepID=UPI003D91BF5C